MEERNIQGVKTIFIPAYVGDVDIDKTLNKLKIKENKIGLISAVQYIKYLEIAKKYLESKGKEVHIAGQMVGCNAAKAIRIKENVDCFIFVGSGEFHPLELIEVTKINDVYLLNPHTEKITKFKKEDIEKLEKKRQGKLARYQLAKKIGIIVSTKPGQQALKTALKFKETCGKNSFVFLGDEIDIRRLEDFNDIEMWVNTCCPRLEGNNVISLKDIMKEKLVTYHTY